MNEQRNALWDAYYFASQGKTEEARKVLVAAPAMKASVAGRDLLARIALQEGKEGEAKRQWRSILDQEPDNLVARAALEHLSRRRELFWWRRLFLLGVVAGIVCFIRWGCRSGAPKGEIKASETAKVVSSVVAGEAVEPVREEAEECEKEGLKTLEVVESLGETAESACGEGAEETSVGLEGGNVEEVHEAAEGGAVEVLQAADTEREVDPVESVEGETSMEDGVAIGESGNETAGEVETAEKKTQKKEKRRKGGRGKAKEPKEEKESEE